MLILFRKQSTTLPGSFTLTYALSGPQHAFWRRPFIGEDEAYWYISLSVFFLVLVSCPALLIYFFIVRPCCQKKPICCLCCVRCCCCRRLSEEELEDRREKEILKQIDAGNNNRIVPVDDNRPPDPNNDSEIAMVVARTSKESGGGDERGARYEDSDLGAESVFDERGTALGLYATNGAKEADNRLQSQGNESHDFYINEIDDQIKQN